MLSGLVLPIDKTHLRLQQLVLTLFDQAKALEEAGEHAKSVAVYGNAIDAAIRIQHAELPDLYLRRARLHLKLQQYSKTQSDCEAAERIQPDHPDIILIMRALHQNSKEQFVTHYLNEDYNNLSAADRKKYNPKIATTALELTHQAFDFFTGGNYDQAIATAGQSLKIYPSFISYFLRAKAYLNQKKLERVRDTCSEGLKLNPAPSLYFLRGKSYSDLGLHSKAKSDLLAGMSLDKKSRTLCEEDNDYVLLSLNRAEMHEQVERQKGEEEFEFKETDTAGQIKKLSYELLENKTNLTDSNLYYQRGMLHFHEKEYQKAIENFTFAIWMSVSGNHKELHNVAVYIAARRKSHLWAGHLQEAEKDQAFFFEYVKNTSQSGPSSSIRNQLNDDFSQMFDMHVKRKSGEEFANECIEKANYEFSRKKWHTALPYYFRAIYLMQTVRTGKLDLGSLALLADKPENMAAYIASKTKEELREQNIRFQEMLQAPTPNAGPTSSQTPITAENYRPVNAADANRIIKKLIANARDLATKGDILEEQETIDTAIALLDNAISLATETHHPLLGAAYSLRGECHYKTGKHLLACNDLSSAISINASATDYYYRGMCAIQLSQHGQAEADFIQCFSLDPEGKALLFQNQAFVRGWTTIEEQIEFRMESDLTKRNEDASASSSSCPPLPLTHFIQSTQTDDISDNPYLQSANYFARSKAYRQQERLSLALNDLSVAIWLCASMNDRAPAQHVTELYQSRSEILLEIGYHDKALLDRSKLHSKMEFLTQEEAKALSWINLEELKKTAHYNAKQKDYKKNLKKYFAINFAQAAIRVAEAKANANILEIISYYRSALVSLADVYADQITAMDAGLLSSLGDTSSSFVAAQKDNEAAIQTLVVFKSITTKLFDKLQNAATPEKRPEFSLSAPRIKKVNAPMHTANSGKEVEATETEEKASAAIESESAKEALAIAQKKHADIQAKRKSKREKSHLAKLARIEEANMRRAAEEQEKLQKEALAILAKVQAEAEKQARLNLIQEMIAQKSADIEARFALINAQKAASSEDHVTDNASETSQEESPATSASVTPSIITTDDSATSSPNHAFGFFAKSTTPSPELPAMPMPLESKTAASGYEVPQDKNKVGVISECDYLKRITHIQRKAQDEIPITVLGGGLPRNLQGRLKHKTDIDIFTNATREQIAKAFPVSHESDVASIKYLTDTFGDLYTVRFKNGKKIQVVRSAALIETKGTFDEKLLALAKSLDYTINALLLDERGRLFAPLPTTLSDVENKLLLTIKPPAISFQESPIRILRGIDFAARFNINIEKSNPGLAAAMQQYAPLILEKELPVKISMCMQKLLASGYSYQSFYHLTYYGILTHLMPKLSLNMGQNFGWLQNQLLTTDARQHSEKPSINRIYMIMIIASAVQDFQRFAVLSQDVQSCINQNDLLRANFSGYKFTDTLRDELTLDLLQYLNAQIAMMQTAPPALLPPYAASGLLLFASFPNQGFAQRHAPIHLKPIADQTNQVGQMPRL